jgi:hypothetical protein
MVCKGPVWGPERVIHQADFIRHATDLTAEGPDDVVAE